MKLSALFLLLFSLCLQADTVSIFDGKSLDGWEGNKKFWRVKDGAITGQSTAENPCKNSSYLTYIKKEFANFELTVSFRFLTKQGNSGIQYRSSWQNKKQHQIKGYQADLEAGKTYSGILYEQNGRGIVAKRGQNINITAAGKSIIDKTPLADAEKAQQSIKHGEWNTYRIVAEGNTLTHQINGFTTIIVEDNDTNRKSAKGLIALQIHSGPAMTVQYKNIRILELPDTLAQQPAHQPVHQPEWIWGGEAKQNQTLFFTTEFTQKNPPTRPYILQASCDNSCVIWINGKEVARSNNWKKPISKNVAGFLREGKNTIQVKATNQDGPAGLLVKLGNNIISNKNWKCHDEAKKPLPTTVLGKHGAAPWGKVLTIHVPPSFTAKEGFSIEKIHSVDRATKSSWVAMCFDDKGVLYVCDQYGSLYRIILENGKVKSIKKVDSPGHAQGLCWAYGSLYISSHTDKNSGVYRLTDSNNDGIFEKQELIIPLPRSGEHGFHGITKTHDGKDLYIILGNYASPPKDATSISNRNWAKDTLHPHLPDASGHAVKIKAPGGTLLRISPDGKQRKIISSGMRNTYDIAVSPTGDVFGYDADMEWDIGTPWYRPTRVLHLIEGGEYGWRTGTAKWPAYYADSLGSVIDIGPGCPTGVTFGTGSKFPAKYQRALYVLDWTFGRIYAVHLTPDGVSYKATKEPFVSGKPLPVTDVAISPDGAMYFLTGGRRLESALYKVSYTGSESTAPVPATEPSTAQLNLRDIQHSTNLDNIWKTIGSNDRTLRFSARVALERIPSQQWMPRYSKSTDPKTIITASIALARNNAPAEVISKKLLEIDFTKLTPPLKLEYLRAFSLTFIRGGKPDSSTKKSLTDSLEKHYPSADASLNRELSRMLTYLESPQVISKTTFLMQSSIASKEDISAELIKANDQYGKDFKNMLKNQPDSQALHYALMLKNVKKGWSASTVKSYYTWLANAESKSGGNSYKGFIKNIRTEAMKHLSPELLAIAEETTKSAKANTASKPLPTAKGPGVNWTMERSLKAVQDLSKANRSNGHKMFQAALCARCHTHSGEGGSAGPELSNLATRFTKKDILKAIIHPSEVISEQYNATTFHLKDKRTITGKIMKEDAKHIYIALSAFDLSQQTPILKTDILKQKKSPVSTMPPSLINSLNADELRDLMLFLTSQAKSK